MPLEIAAAASLVIWLYLLFGRGGFWRTRPTIMSTSAPTPAPRIAIVIPARNEAAVIERAIASLEAQQYPGEFRIFVVDDHSSDGTAALARAASQGHVSVLQAPALERGWTGKLWAVSQGVQAAAQFAPHYFLLTDADIVHPTENLAALTAQAAKGYDLVSLMVRLNCRTLAERALIPAFVFFFFMLYPPAWIADARRRTAGAAGGCILIHRDILERIGGIGRIRGALIDDCALAEAVKRAGGRVWLGLSTGAESIREYRNFGEIFRMISRTAFTQLRYSPLLLAGTMAGLALTYFVPPVATIFGSVAGLLTWIAMSIAYLPILLAYRRSLLWAPVLPGIAAFYTAATLHSAIAYWRGAGGMWKGRAQAATE